MIVSATVLANDSKSIIDRVITRRETVEVQRHGRAVVQIRRKIGVSGKELAERLKEARFTSAEQHEMQTAMDAANQVFRHADRH